MCIKTMPLWKWVLKLFVSLILAFLLFIAVAKAMSAINVGWVKCLAVVFYTAAMIALYALFVRLFEGNSPMDIPMRKMPFLTSTHNFQQNYKYLITSILRFLRPLNWGSQA